MKTWIKFGLTIIFLLPLVAKGQSLEEYLKLGAENNPGLKAKYAEFEAAMQRVPQMGSLPDPTFSYGYFISPVETRVGAQRMRFSLSQMFPWFGTLAAQKDATALMAQAKYQAFLDAKNEVFQSVKIAYYPLAELEQIIKLQEENLEILKTYQSISTSEFKNGKASMVDVLRTNIMINDAETELEILKAKRKPLQAVFNNLLNRNSGEEVVIGMLSEELVAGIELSNEQLQANPKLAELDEKMKAAEAQRQAAKKMGLPKIGLGMDYVLVDKRTDMAVPDNGKDVFMPMLSVSLPIYRKKYNAMSKEAELMREAASMMKEQTINSLNTSYEMAQFEMEKSRRISELMNEQVEQTQQALDLLLVSYGNSGKDFEEILRMQQQLLKYEIAKTGAIKDFYIALSKLEYLVAKDLNKN